MHYIAVRAMASLVINEVYSPLISLSPTKSTASLPEIMRKGIQAAHLAIIKHAPGGGTTLTGVLILGDQMTIAHVGDSRAYTIHPEGRIQVLTRDHSLVKRLVELGQITSAEAAVHPQRNVLYRALGQGEPIDAEIITAPVPKSSYLLLCSDGLWGVVAEREVFKLVTSAPSPTRAAKAWSQPVMPLEGQIISPLSSSVCQTERTGEEQSGYFSYWNERNFGFIRE